MTGPVESKVYAGAIGTGAGAVISAVTLWGIGVGFYRVPNSADTATDAILAVPGPVSAFIGLLITVGLGFLSAFMAKHTPRFDKAAIEASLPAEQEAPFVLDTPSLEVTTNNVEVISNQDAESVSAYQGFDENGPYSNDRPVTGP